MAKVSRVVTQKILIQMTSSEAKEITGQLQEISARDGKSGFSAAETKMAKKLLRRHGLGFKMDSSSISDLQEAMTKECHKAEHPCHPDMFCYPNRDITLYATRNILGGGYIFLASGEGIVGELLSRSIRKTSYVPPFSPF